MKTYRHLAFTLSYDIFIVSWGLYLFVFFTDTAKKGFMASIFNTNILLVIALVAGGVAMFAFPRPSSGEATKISKISKMGYGLAVAATSCTAAYLAYRYAGVDAPWREVLAVATFFVLSIAGWIIGQEERGDALEQ